MSVVLVLKLVLVPLLIWGVTLASRRWGPTVGGWLSAFPIFSAPVLLIIAIEHGAAFTSAAAVGTLSSVAANVAFGLGYAWGATRYAWPMSLAIGFTSYFAAVAGLTAWAPALYLAVPMVLAVLLIAPQLYPVLVRSTPSKAALPPGNDLAWRIGTALVTVFLITQFSSLLGPRLSGSLAMFPLLASVLVVFSQRQYGVAFAIQLLRGMVLGYYSFAAFCLVLTLTLTRTSIGLAFLVSLAAAALVQATSRLLIKPPSDGAPRGPFRWLRHRNTEARPHQTPVR